MFFRALGEVRARLAFCLALVMILAFPGCGPSTVPLIGPKSVTVRSGALLPLHPAWQQVVSLDQAIAQFASAGVAGDHLAWNPPALPRPFRQPDAVPAGLARERDQRVKADARKYVVQVTQSLRNQADQHFLRVERTERKRLEIEIVAETGRREAELRTENTRAAHFLDLDIRKLGFRDVALQSQIHVYTGLSLQDAVTQRAKVRVDIAALVEKRDLLLNADVKDIVAKAMGPFRAQLTAQVDARLKQDREKVQAQVAARIASETQRVNVEADPIPALGNVPLPPQNKSALPLTLSEHAEAIGTVGQEQRNAAVARQRAVWQLQRARLVQVIQEDTEKAVASYIRKQGWIMAKPQDARAIDVTGEASDAIRAEWRRGGQD